MATIATTITAVFKNERNSAKGPFNSYDVKAGGRKYQTTKDDIGALAEKLKGQPVVISYTESQRGEYMNYNITTIVPAEAETGHVAPAGKSYDDDRQERIERQSARRDAIAFARLGLVEIQSKEDLYAIADDFARYAQYGHAVPDEDPQY